MESLINLVQVTDKSDDLATVRQIHQILRPFEYTKVDRIVDILFATANDVESVQEEKRIEQSPLEREANEVAGQVQVRTEQSLIEQVKQRAIEGFSIFKGQELARRGKSYFWSSDKTIRACCTVSKRYERDYQPYWYAYHPKWDAFLSEGDGYLILGCMDLDSCFAIPHIWFAKNAQYLNRTEQEDRSYWHLAITTLADKTLAINMPKINQKYPLEPHRIPLARL